MARFSIASGRREGSTTRRYQGVGIGLAWSRNWLEFMAGKFQRKANSGVGTTMKFHVDVSRPPIIELSDQPVAESLPNQEEADWLNRLYRRAELFPAHVLGASDSNLAEKDKSSLLPHVLLVDDEPDMRRFLNSQLEDKYSISEASSGAVALELVKENHFSLILLDFMMPEMDGIEVIETTQERSGDPVDTGDHADGPGG